MEKMHKRMEKALVSAIMAGMLGFGVIALVMGAAGVLLSSVNGIVLLLGYLTFCAALWLVFMLQ